jgi:hypothetical protein
MRIELAEDLFPVPPSASQLHALVAMAFEGRHRLLVANDQAPEFKGWLDALGQLDREEWELVTAEGFSLEAIEPAVRSVVITRGGASDWSVTPAKVPLSEAFAFLSAPFKLLLEDYCVGSTQTATLLERPATSSERLAEHSRSTGRGAGVTGCGRLLWSDGEIKGAGPFGSKALMVLENFRDLDFSPGPGFLRYSRDFRALSGT